MTGIINYTKTLKECQGHLQVTKLRVRVRVSCEGLTHPAVDQSSSCSASKFVRLDQFQNWRGQFVPSDFVRVQSLCHTSGHRHRILQNKTAVTQTHRNTM